MNTKNCARCKSTKEICEFGPHRTRADGLNHYCRECSRIAGRKHSAKYQTDADFKKKKLAICAKWRKKNRQAINERGKVHQRKRKFGISAEQYNKMLSDQCGLCEICKRKDFRNLAVDHNHVTGKIRGLLCTRCNIGMGFFEEDVERLLQAQIYLRKYEDR